MTELSSYELSLKIAKAAADKKAFNIKMVKVGEISIVADYFLIASGSSTKQVQAISENIKDALKKEEIMSLRVEGLNEGRWTLFDYGNVVVHVFLEEERDFYNLEGLWGDVLQEDYADEA